ncbi:glycoside hydrolase family 88/105 protein [Metabacillus arenae]|uniref:Glycoside hydrolase family 88 protein n=1 Tax=Metabacillus arenae TaxID=2771434 RepID=A0A926RV82_9BACI|nr:glycoside hydrolase family 88 protein [Metabacillus arenae]MBD1379413.1 glycoside hydrolase family 88 protein [Metabacillus arenae]
MSYQMVEKLKRQYMNGSGNWYLQRWHYIEGCILKSYLDSYSHTGSEEEYSFVKKYIDSLFNEEGMVEGIDSQYYNIDQIRMTSILFPLYKKEQDPKYKRILDLIYKQLETYPRTKSGNFWHKTNYPNQIWLDGLYMGQPFYVQYIKEFEKKKNYSDTLNQFRNVRKFLFDEETQLYRHAYDESRGMFWCDKTTGRSPHVWGRAVGWFAMALVDTLELLESEDVNTDELKCLLKEAVDGMLCYQHSNGMWYQVVDFSDEKGNYLETSGTLMLAYAILKGVRLGYLSDEYKKHGKAAFDGTLEQYIREEDGNILLGGICKSAGLGKHPETGVIRDGSFKYYVSGEQIVQNNGHGVAPLLMAYNEIQLIV